MSTRIKCLSLFSSIGLAEVYFKDIGLDVVLANELLEDRCKLYSHLYPETELIEGDIADIGLRKRLIQKAKNYKVDFIIATPPCQGMSRHGKRDKYDPRNQLIFYAIDIIKKVKPKFVLIENVPRQLSTRVIYNNRSILIPDYIKLSLEKYYKIYDDSIFNSADYGIPQSRKRSITRMVSNKSSITWGRPAKNKSLISMEEAIGHLPSLDPYIRQEDKRSFFPNYENKKAKGLRISKWHYPPTHSWHHIEWMMHTPSGKSAFENKIFYPQKDRGIRINGRISTYKRYAWDKPANTLTQNNGVISSAVCVHPGRLTNKSNNEKIRIYSDSRVLTIYELMIISSLPLDWNIPEWATEKLIRNGIGEGVPPLLVKRIIQEILD
jgi:DNA (cytosine-5)-methyltransferase 1